MEPGDKVICKKELNKNGIIFNIGKEYTILIYNFDDIFISIGYASGLWFNRSDDKDSVLPTFTQHFYSKEEIRLLKLKSI